MSLTDIVYRTDEAGLEPLLRSIDRAGDYCAHGRSFYPMPLISVDGVGVLSFPVPEAQVRALVAVAERAPYGRGTETRVDTSVRNCWQIDASRVEVAGGAWPATRAQILDAAAKGLGCPPGRVEAHLYKLLVYEPGGFFAPHRDTEKADRMVATLSISLPTSGAGGALAVRHRGREMVIEMNAGEPSELAFAAFYADCEHETRPVLEGHRLSLVFNLCVRAGDDPAAVRPPDFAARVATIAELLGDLAGDAAGGKLVWLLEHEYTQAGLSFDTLKNADAAVARALGQAAARADCAIHAAIVQIRRRGGARVEDEYIDSWNVTDYDAADLEMDDEFETDEWLEGWASQDGSRPAFERIPLLPGELLPRGALDGADPDEKRLREATGNEGVTLERTYRRAALVVWPRARTLDVMVSAGAERAVAWVTEEHERRDAAAGDYAQRLVARLIDVWPADDDGPSARASRLSDFWPDRGPRPGESARCSMLRLLVAVGDASLGVRFLRRVVLADYSGRENDDLPAAFGLVGPHSAAELLPELSKRRFADLPEDVLDLQRRVDERESADRAWRGPVQAGLRATLQAAPAAVEARAASRARAWIFDPRPFDERFVRNLFGMAWRHGLLEEAEPAGEAISRSPKAVSPDRVLPAALRDLYRETGLAATGVYVGLWRTAAGALLARSSTPPAAPRDWSIAADLSCDCDLCRRLRSFCEDPDTRQARFPLREDLRAHLDNVIREHRLDLDHETEREDRLAVLVCTKSRASHERRDAEYREDVSWMQSLLDSVPRSDDAELCPAEGARLRQAIAAARRVG